MSEKGIALKWPDSNALKLMSTQELAEALGVDVKTIRRNAQKLGFSGLSYAESAGGRPAMAFTAEQADRIEEEVAHCRRYEEA